MGLKTGYSDVDNQKLGSATLAGRLGGFDALLIATRRDKTKLRTMVIAIMMPPFRAEPVKNPDPYDINQKVRS